MTQRLLFVLILLSSIVYAVPLTNYHGLMVNTVNVLASAQYEGRRPGTPGGDKSTQYLIKKIQELGIKETSEFPGFKQDFTIFTRMSKNGVNELIHNQRVIPFEPISFSMSGKLQSKDLVFAGFGISIPDNDQELKYDDYAGLDVKDKVVVILTGDPGTGNPSSLFRKAKYFSYHSVHYKLNNAMIHGAKGALLIQDPLSQDDPTKSSQLFFNSEEGGGSRISILAGNVQMKWFDKLLAKKQTSTLKLQKKMAKTQKPNSFALNSESIDLQVHLKKETGRVANVVAYLPGTDENLKKEVIVIGGHFDHLGYGGTSSLEPTSTPQIHHGADDNASGTALSLALLQELSRHQHKRSFMFVFFNAEESGLLGSKYFVSAWPRYEQSLGKLKGMLNFDMVGRFDKILTVMGTGSAYEWDNLLNKTKGDIQSGRNHNMLLPMIFQKASVGSSDHSSFITGKIPALFFTTGAHGDYHRASDTADKIRFDEMFKLHFFAKHFASLLAQGESLTFDPDALKDQGADSGDRGYGAHLGCVPEFGQSSNIVGVLCTRTSPQSPAQKAGLRGGDILKAIGDIDIKSIYDLAFALKYYRSGDKVLLKWERNGKELQANITLSSRKR